MSKDAQTQATEGQSAATPGAHVAGGHTRAHAEAHQARGPEGQPKQEKVKLVKVRFDGTADPETTLLEHAGWRLHKGQEAEVPESVLEQLTQGDNAMLYRVVRVDDEDEKADKADESEKADS